ncbi:hypothetical protein WJX79_003168 [Trebouxia sp. C0005]
MRDLENFQTALLPEVPLDKGHHGPHPHAIPGFVVTSASSMIESWSLRKAHAQPLDTADNLHLSASNRSKTYHDAPSFGYMPQLAREGQHGRLNFEDHLGLVRAWNNLQVQTNYLAAGMEHANAHVQSAGSCSTLLSGYHEPAN